MNGDSSVGGGTCGVWSSQSDIDTVRSISCAKGYAGDTESRFQLDVRRVVLGRESNVPRSEGSNTQEVEVPRFTDFSTPKDAYGAKFTDIDTEEGKKVGGGGSLIGSLRQFDNGLARRTICETGAIAMGEAEPREMM